MIPADLIARYDRRVPRYTSYPTALQFEASVDAATYEGWLGALPEGDALSLYLHVPFCRALCLFCGCHTTVIRHDAPALSYANVLLAEIDLVADRIGRRQRVTHVHWGGGTPTTLPAESMRAIDARLRERFDFAPDTEIAVELDPRTLTEAASDTLVAIGANRASLGVQDLDGLVQATVNRVQPYEMIARGIAGLRARGIASISIDLMYGLPLQTVAGFGETVRQVLALAPDRLAVFGYAHVPWMKAHQRLLAEADLPDAAARWAQREAAERVLHEHGYESIGLDHYAHADDAISIALKSGHLRRNFQGYTTDGAAALVGLGASAIGSLAQGYVQNAPSVPTWRSTIESGQLGTARGRRLVDDDRLRRDVIERIMCDLEVDLDACAAAFGAAPGPLHRAIEDLAGPLADELVEWDGRRLTVTERGRPFVRTIAAVFDIYHQSIETRHAPAV